MSKPPGDFNLAEAALNALPQATAILDEHRTVVQVNTEWLAMEEASDRKSPGGAACGENYLDCWRRHPEHKPEADALADALAQQKKEAGDFELLYSFLTSRGKQHFRLRVYPIKLGRNHLLLMRQNITSDHQRNTRESTLLAVDETLALRDNTEAMVERALTKLHQTAKSDISVIFLWQEKERVFLPHPVIGGSEKDRQILQETRLERHQPFGELMKESRGTLYRDLPNQNFLPRSLWQGLGLREFITAPLQTNTQVMGIILVARSGDGAPLEDAERRLCRAVGRRLAFGLENAHLMRALADASRLKSEFVATMSHELRTPLHVVLGYADLLLDDAFGSLNQPQRDSLERIERSGAALLELINETLNLSQLDSGELPITLEDVDLRALFSRIASEGAVPLDSGDVAYRTEIAENLPEIFSDRGKIEVIVRNLLSNAFKFTTKGFVVLAAEATDDGVCLSVRDTGEGMSQDTLKFVFEPFRQGADPLTRKVGGAGLGLHLVERYVEILGGTVSVTSQPGEGSIFTLHLPMRQRTLRGENT